MTRVCSDIIVRWKQKNDVLIWEQETKKADVYLKSLLLQNLLELDVLAKETSPLDHVK